MPPPGVCLNIMEARHRQDGYGSPTNPENFLNQDYNQLKEYCIIKGVRYIDEMFPPDRTSIGEGILSPSDLARVVWLRPAKISPNPSFVLDGVSRFDFGQGLLGNCWFLASIGALTFQPDILGQVVPLEQTFDENYCGLFHFKFWRFGRWVDVIIDDKLPTINGRLIFVHSIDQNEFWPALMEKAYAKVCGSYTDMNAGTPSEAMMDFTGGVHICIELSNPPLNLWEMMCRAGQSKSLIGCGTPQGVTLLSPMMIAGQMMSQGKVVNLVRLWNPWGKGEWNGDWSDRSSLWQTVSAQDRKICLSVDDDGEFWMTLEDFCRFYSDLDICCLCPDFLDGNSSCQWKTSLYEGRWVAGTTAGGCMNNRDSFWTNPQYRVKIDGEYSEKTGSKNVLLSLMQKPDKRNRRLVQNLHIGFSNVNIYLLLQYKEQKGKFPASFFSSQAPAAQTKTYMNAREVMEFVLLKPGEYLIVPSSFNPNETASFILTIHSKAETHGLFFFLGDLKSGGFTIDACRSMVALMDTSITGKLNDKEFVRLWKKVITYKDIFFLTDVSRTGTLSLSELRNAFVASGMMVSDDMLNLMALRYSDSSGHMSLESFISLILRLDCMYKIFRQLSSDGKSMNLREAEVELFTHHCLNNLFLYT
uniref:Calpain catalytic domain-containing protein n=1 Tax=Dicentrarchus labrax TaxID=13489 RepID=A0A8C4D9W1_DICLA